MRHRMAVLTLIVLALGCKLPRSNNLPPAAQIMEPGPGVGGPGPGVFAAASAAGPYMGAASELAFVGPEGMTVAWDVSAAGMFDSEPLICPGRYNFPQGAIYRLSLTNIPSRPGIELFPSVEVGPTMPRTAAYLAHCAIPIQFTEEDFDQVLTGNFVTKVIYLPDAEFQELAVAGVETLVSTRLDPGVDPIIEADRRGSILAIIRLGNKDLAAPGGDGGGGMMDGGVMCAGYDGAACGAGGQGLPPPFVAGVTAPQYGMPMSGTPIGLPGPPHIPLGIPAGLQKHTIKNHTHYHIPEPVDHMKVHVKHSPGFSYPHPVDHVRIHERTHSPFGVFRQPHGDRHETVNSRGAHGGDAYCPPE